MTEVNGLRRSAIIRGAVLPCSLLLVLGISSCRLVLGISAEQDDDGGTSDSGGSGDSRGDDAGHDDGGTCAPPFGLDAFERNGTGGLGLADEGGLWTVTEPSVMSVSNGAARAALTAGRGSIALLPDARRDVDLSVTLTTDKASNSTTDGIYGYLYARSSPSASYFLSVAIQGTNQAALVITRRITNAQVPETNLKTLSPVFGIEYVAGMQLRLRFLVEGTSPTRLRGKIWRVDEEKEPTAWLVEAMDTEPLLQTSGLLGFKGYLSLKASVSPLTMTFDDFIAREPNSCVP